MWRTGKGSASSCRSDVTAASDSWKFLLALCGVESRPILLSEAKVGNDEGNRSLPVVLGVPGPAAGPAVNGYAFFAPGGVSCCGYTATTLHFGFGGEAVIGKGF